MSESEAPARTAGLRHVALNVHAFEECLTFYTRLLGMAVEWRPDEDTVFLTSGNDNLALWRSPEPACEGTQRLDHLGFIVDRMDDVDVWYARLRDAGVPILREPRTHRDGARSFSCEDPDGTKVQVIFHPPISGG